MDNFGRQKFDSDGQFCASDTQTDTQTDRQTHGHTLNLYIYWTSRSGLRRAGGWTVVVVLFVGFIVLWPWWPRCVFPYNGYGNSMSIYVRNPSASLKWLSCLWMFRFYCGGLVCNFGGFVSFLAGLFGFILAGTDIPMMDNFGRQKSKIQFRWTILCLGHTHRHTDTLLIFIPPDKPRSGLTPLISKRHNNITMKTVGWVSKRLIKMKTVNEKQ